MGQSLMIPDKSLIDEDRIKRFMQFIRGVVRADLQDYDDNYLRALMHEMAAIAQGFQGVLDGNLSLTDALRSTFYVTLNAPNDPVALARLFWLYNLNDELIKQMSSEQKEILNKTFSSIMSVFPQTRSNKERRVRLFEVVGRYIDLIESGVTREQGIEAIKAAYRQEFKEEIDARGTFLSPEESLSTFKQTPFGQSVQFSNATSDAAMMPKTPGGIDLNANERTLEEQGDTIKFPLPTNPSDWQNFQTNGFIPVIIHITPPVSLPALLGLENKNNESRFPSLVSS